MASRSPGGEARARPPAHRVGAAVDVGRRPGRGPLPASPRPFSPL